MDLSELTRALLATIAAEPERTLRLVLDDPRNAAAMRSLDLGEELLSFVQPSGAASSYIKAVAAATASSKLQAFASVVALNVLDASSPHALRDELGWMPKRARLNIQQRASRTGVGLSEPLLATITEPVRQTAKTWIHTIATWWVTHSESVQPPVSMLAGALHPAWRAEFTHLKGDLVGAATVAGLLATSADRSIGLVATDLGLGHIADDVERAWEYLVSMPARQEARCVLCRMLHPNYLASPIDFGARRTEYPNPADLPSRVATALAHELGHHSTPALRLTASFFVWERITGSNALLAPRGLHLHAGFRLRYRHRRDAWNRQLPETLGDYLQEWTRTHDPGTNLSQDFNPSEMREEQAPAYMTPVLWHRSAVYEKNLVRSDLTTGLTSVTADANAPGSLLWGAINEGDGMEGAKKHDPSQSHDPSSEPTHRAVPCPRRVGRPD